MKTEFESLELISFKPNVIALNLHQVRVSTFFHFDFLVEHSHLEHVTWFHSIDET